MKHIKQGIVPIVLASSLIICASPVLAADQGWYLGLNLGKSFADIDDEGIARGLASGGLTTTSISDDDRDRGYKLLAGYQLSRHIALEAGYFDLGQFGFSASTVPAGTYDGQISIKGLNMDVLARLPLNDEFSLFARAGATYAEVKGKFATTGLVNNLHPTTENSEFNYKFGVGMEYAFTENFGVRAEAERYRINDTVSNIGDVDLFSLGLVYRFGHSPAVIATATPTPAEPVAVAPIEPEVVIVPVVETEQYCSILDLQFEIDQNTVQLEYEEKIDTLGLFMKKYPKTSAVIQGHSDNVGSEEDNLRLSRERAESVRRYLIARHGIATDRLKAEGYGEMRPIADNQTEAGKRKNRRINAIIGCATDVEGLIAAPVRITMAMDMNFDSNRAEVKQIYFAELQRVAIFMQANPGITAVVEGHASNQQGPAGSMELSRQRAKNVVKTLVDVFKVSPTRLSAEGFGNTRRMAYNTSVEGQQANRRVNIIFDLPRK